jgi:hypothetical protein
MMNYEDDEMMNEHVIIFLLDLPILNNIFLSNLTHKGIFPTFQ